MALGPLYIVKKAMNELFIEYTGMICKFVILVSIKYISLGSEFWSYLIGAIAVTTQLLIHQNFKGM